MNFEYTDEQSALREEVRNWVETVFPKTKSNEFDRRIHEYPTELWDELSAAGYNGIGIPEEYGGRGGSAIEQAIFVRELARSLAGMTWIWGISSFCAKSINLHGSDSLKSRMLPQLARGDIRLAISVTEPGGGTDVLGAMKTVATRVDGGWIINGQKKWSGTADVAEYLMLLAKTDPGAEKKTQGNTIFLVPNPSDGLSAEPIPKLGMNPIASCLVTLENVFVPDELVVGDVGGGWYQMLATLNNERILLAGVCCGVIDGVLEDATEYALHREAFGVPIGTFQALQHFLADIAMAQKQAELLTFYSAWLEATGQRCDVEATMAKVVSSELTSWAADTGIQILGGNGYALEYNMQRYWRDTRQLRIGPVSNEVARNYIAEQLGMPRSY